MLQSYLSCLIRTVCGREIGAISLVIVTVSILMDILVGVNHLLEDNPFASANIKRYFSTPRADLTDNGRHFIDAVETLCQRAIRIHYVSRTRGYLTG